MGEVRMAHTMFYDGVCGLCDRLTRFVVERDRDDAFRFAALQGGHARATLRGRGVDLARFDTVVVLTDSGDVLTKSDAVIFVLRQLGGVWGVLALGRWLPRTLRDWVYDFVAQRRFAWFGRLDACRIPTADERAKFISD